jgi:hypothetical protein
MDAVTEVRVERRASKRSVQVQWHVSKKQLHHNLLTRIIWVNTTGAVACMKWTEVTS